MAVLCGLSLRVLWISCLLISSVTCFPAREGYGSPGPGGYMPWSSSGSSIPRGYPPLKAAVKLAPAGNDAVGSGSSKPGLDLVGTGSSSSNFGSTGGDHGYIDFAGYGSPAPGGSSTGSSVPNEYYPPLRADVNRAPTGNDARGVGSGSGNPGLGFMGTGSSSSGSTAGGDDHVDFSSEGEEERPQPVFSDVSNMEPVYIFRSRSSYRTGRRHFSKTRYTPGEIVFP